MKQNYISKILILFSLCLAGKMSFAQTFEQVLPPPPAPQIISNIEGVQNSSIAFADVDGDGDQDVLITGGSGNQSTVDGEGAKAILYLNDGTGNYTEDIGTPFMGVQNGSIAFADIDGDGDPDVLITGSTGGGMFPTMGGGESIAILYINNGFGNFQELLGAPFEGVQNSSIAFADVDGDNDQDVLITGSSGDPYNGGVASSNLYLNDGNGNYTKDNNSFFEGVQNGSVAFADVDRDGHQDVLITGMTSSDWQEIPSSKLYINDGAGNFVEDINASFPGVGYSSIAFADVNGNGSQDVLITGRDNNYNSIAKLYKNDGAGKYSEATGVSFEGVQEGSVAFADVDGDNDQDVLITGYFNSSKLYKNDGAGNFSEDINASFAGVQSGALAFADIDGDNDQDLLITGSENSSNPVAKLYVNDGSANYLEPTGTFFAGVQNSSIAFADIDGDGDQDVLVTGTDKANNVIAKLYENDDAGNYSEVIGTPFEGVFNGSIAFADIDRDGDQDVLIVGRGISGNIAKLYKNDGSATFLEVTGTPFNGVQEGSIAFADIDGDGDQDVLVTGINNSNTRIAKLYENDGEGNYSEITGTPFDGVRYSSIAFADIDGDGDQDVLITGGVSSSNLISKLYKNDGSANYSEVTGIPFAGVQNSSVAFADVDGDGDQDLLITGYSKISYGPTSILYKNDGAGNYLETNTSLPGVQKGSIAFADVDGDGDQDVLLTGTDTSYQGIAKLYVNDGTGNFSEVFGMPFTGVKGGSIAFADIDRDNDKDLLITGRGDDGLISLLYRNTSISTTPPVVDETAPMVQTFSPAHQTTDVPLQPTLSVTFDEVVELNSSGILTLKDPNGVVQTYDLSVQEDRGKFLFSEDKLTVSLKIDENLPGNTTLSVGISSGFVKDESGNGNGVLDASSNAWTFTTTKLDQTITFTEISTKTYGDSSFTLGDEKTDKDLVVTYTAQDPDVISISGNTATILKAGTTKITATQAGDDTHFAATPVIQTLTVSKADITVTADAKSKVYGEEDPELTYEITLGALVGEDSFTGEITRAAGEKAGTYMINQGTLALSSNYNLTYKSADLIINKAEAVITADAVQTFTYDGTVKNVAATLNHSETALTYDLQQGYTNAGTYPVTISTEATENYEAASKEMSLVIEKAEITGVTFETGTFTYNGTEHSIAVNGLPEDATVVYSNNNGQTNAGTYTVTATVSRENYNDKELTADLIINKAEAIITADAIQTFTYDGTVKNISAELNHEETLLTFTPQQGYTDAGNYKVTVASEETGNYLPASKEVSLVIENAEITGVTFEDKSFTYNGEAHSLNVKGFPEAATVVYSDNNGQTNAGTYTVTAAVRRENYNDQVLTADLVIDKAEAVITADAIQTFTYDGTVKNVSAQLNHEETALTYAPQQGYTDAGNYKVTVASEETGNYLSASKEVSLVIDNADITGVAFEEDTYSFTYDGTEHSIAVNGLPENAEVSYDANGKTNAGNYTVTATVSQENYNDKVLTADLIINKAEAIITADAIQTFTYDGTVKNISAELNHTETALTYAPQQGYTNAGTYPVTISTEATENYEAASKEVSLVIDNAEIIGVTFEDKTFVYNGTEHGIAVTGLPEAATVAYSDNNGHTKAGTYTVTATVSRENYDDKVITAEFTINKAEAIITADAIQTFTYDGTVKNVAAELNHTETALTFTPQQVYTNAGTYKVTVASEETGNYLSASKEVSLVIENAQISGVAFEEDTYSFTYDGTEHSIAVNGLPENAEVSYDANGKTNAGNYTVTATVSQENYNDKVLTADLIINKAEAIITADAIQTSTYDGTVKNVSAELNHEETLLTFTPQQGYIDAGNYKVTVASEETGNYLSASKEVSLVIENAEITGVAFEEDTYTFTYDGTEHSIAANGLPENAEVSYDSNGKTNAGNYTVTATVSQENYNDKVITAKLIIEKAEAVINANAIQTSTYDGTVKNIAAELNHEETLLTFTPQQGYINAGTYSVMVASEETDNYLSASKEVSLVIEKAEISGVAFEDKTFVYNGTEHSIAVTGIPEAATVVYSDNNGQTNAGTYTMTATVSQENYNDQVLTADLIIEKAEAVITADAIQTFTYDGNVKNVSAQLNHEETALTYAPQRGYTDAGNYKVTVASEETDNYLSASKEVSLVIENAEITGVTFETGTFTYNESEHSIAVTGLPEAATVVYSDNNGQTNAGTYTVTATVSQENFNDQVLTADLIIEKAEAIITAEAIQTSTYDGTVKNVAAELNHTETALTFAPQQGYTNAGTYPVTVASEETDNYLSASEEVSLVIENAEISGVAFEEDTYSFTYDGTEHNIFVTGLPEGATVTYENNGQTNAGTYTVTATVSQENYNDKVITAEFTINKAEAIITADAIQNSTYDGTVKNVAAELNHEETLLTFTPQQGYTNAGTYKVTVASEETDNYLSASEEVSLVIENAEITGVVFEEDTYSFTYDGTEHNIFLTGLPEGAKVTYENNGQTNAGTYTVTATVSRENYEDKVITAEFTINKAEAVITAEAIQTSTYDGTVKNVAAELNHTETALTFAPQQGYTNAGTYKVTVASEGTDNYLSASKEVSLVIENAAITGVSFEGNIEPSTYDGTEHSIFVTGLPEGAKVTYKNNGQTNAGTYTVTATVSLDGYDDLVLTANLVINKAAQSITFDALADRNLQTDSNFLLNATSTSGLAVTYSYSSEDAKPAANVSSRGFVRLLTTGKIKITAAQSGNENYNAAAPITRTLNIASSEAKLDKVVINGTTYANPSAEIYYLIGCGSDENEVHIQLEPNTGSSVDHTTLFTMETPAPGIYHQTVTVTSGDGNSSRVYNITVEKTFNFEDIVVQKFNNVLLVNNNPATNGGYKFASYKWYKNGVLVGTGQYFSEGNNTNNQLDVESTYHVEMTTEDGEILRTCSTIIQFKSSYRVILARNPIRLGEQLELLADFPQEELETMQISIHNLNGTMLKQLRSNNKTTIIELPSNLTSGVYILNCTTNSHSKSLKFIVH